MPHFRPDNFMLAHKVRMNSHSEDEWATMAEGVAKACVGVQSTL